MNNKKGYSPGISWVYGLVSLFGIGVLYIIFSQVFNSYIVPTIKNQVVNGPIAINETTQATILGNIDKYMVFFDFLPYVLFGVVVIYMLVVAFRKEQQEFI